MSIVHTLRGLVDTARICVPTVVDSAFGPVDPSVAQARLEWWSRQLLADVGIDLVVNGREHAGDGSEPLIVMSNHQSHLDIPVLYQSIPGKLRMVAKAELFRIPIFGKAMLAAGFIRIDRADPGKAIDSLRERGASLLAGGTRVWIAPEGTRSRTGKLSPFKSGGFRLALDCKVRILPVAINGTRAALPRGSGSIKPGQRVEVTILPIVDAAAYGVEGRKELSAEVRRRIAGALGQESRR
jgi:1-acyl-sn-glycerol-3-phosphate acyltransferase